MWDSWFSATREHHLKTARVLSKLRVSCMLHSYRGMPIKLLIMKHPVNPNSSVPQAVLQPYQQRSESSLSLDGQGGKHTVSLKKLWLFFLLPSNSVCSALKEKSVKQKTPQREPCLKGRKILDFAHAVFVTLFLLLDFAGQVILQPSWCSPASATVHTWSRTRPEGLTIVLILSHFVCSMYILKYTTSVAVFG